MVLVPTTARVTNASAIAATKWSLAVQVGRNVVLNPSRSRNVWRRRVSRSHNATNQLVFLAEKRPAPKSTSQSTPTNPSTPTFSESSNRNITTPSKKSSIAPSTTASTFGPIVPLGRFGSARITTIAFLFGLEPAFSSVAIYSSLPVTSLHGAVKGGGCVSFLPTLRVMSPSVPHMSPTSAAMHLPQAITLTTSLYASSTPLSVTNAAGWEPKVGLIGPNIRARSGIRLDTLPSSNTARSSSMMATRRSIKSPTTGFIGCWRLKGPLGDGLVEFCGAGIGTVLVPLVSCVGPRKSFVSSSNLVGPVDPEWSSSSAGLAPTGSKPFGPAYLE